MRSFFSIVAIVTLVILTNGNSGMAADENCQPVSGAPSRAWYAETGSDALSNNRVASSTDLLLAGDSDRGCCVLKTPETKCVYTNKAFCMRKAKQANISFEFFNGVECKTIAVCK
jgi:hypothetical protein